jgi:hypothetical protein
LITPEQLDWTIVAVSIEEAAKLYLMTKGLTFAYSRCRQTASTSVIPVLETRDWKPTILDVQQFGCMKFRRDGGKDAVEGVSEPNSSFPEGFADSESAVFHKWRPFLLFHSPQTDINNEFEYY